MRCTSTHHAKVLSVAMGAKISSRVVLVVVLTALFTQVSPGHASDLLKIKRVYGDYGAYVSFKGSSWTFSWCTSDNSVKNNAKIQVETIDGWKTLDTARKTVSTSTTNCSSSAVDLKFSVTERQAGLHSYRLSSSKWLFKGLELPFYVYVDRVKAKPTKKPSPKKPQKSFENYRACLESHRNLNFSQAQEWCAQYNPNSVFG